MPVGALGGLGHQRLGQRQGVQLRIVCHRQGHTLPGVRIGQGRSWILRETTKHSEQVCMNPFSPWMDNASDSYYILLYIFCFHATSMPRYQPSQDHKKPFLTSNGQGKLTSPGTAPGRTTRQVAGHRHPQRFKTIPKGCNLYTILNHQRCVQKISTSFSALKC